MYASPDSPVHLSVSIVVHNSTLSLLAATLDSLAAAVSAAYGDGVLARAALYVVDNASDAAYRSRLELLLARWVNSDSLTLEYLPQAVNLGFGGGHNAVLPRVASDIHLVLNPDAELATTALTRGLAALRADQRIALLSPRFTGESGQQEYLCKAYPSVLVLLLRGFAPAFLRRWFRRSLEAYELRAVCSADKAVEVEIASGCVMLLRTQALRTVRGFNEDFFLYFEDFDLSLRLAQHGRLVFEPTVEVLHHGGYAARKGWRHVRLFVGSGVRFFRLHGWRWI